jgi:putative membrane protein
MRYFYTLLGFILFMMALGFALKNAHPVTIYYYLGFAWQAPLVLVLLITLCVGALAGVVACLPLVVRQRRRMLAQQRELNTANNR